ncbi:MAG: hypothetical protein QXV17_13315 [Candidatus Micrarchaeaceae archaeon]
MTRLRSSTLKESIKQKIYENPAGIRFTDLQNQIRSSSGKEISPSVLSRNLNKLLNNLLIKKDPSGKYYPSGADLSKAILDRSVRELESFLQSKSNNNRISLALDEIIGSPGHPALNIYADLIEEDQLLPLIRLLEKFMDEPNSDLAKKFQVSLENFIKVSTKKIYEKKKSALKNELCRLLSNLEKKAYNEQIKNENWIKELMDPNANSTWLNLYQILAGIKYPIWDVIDRILFKTKKLNEDYWYELGSLFKNKLFDNYTIEVLYYKQGELYSKELEYANTDLDRAQLLQDIRKDVVDKFSGKSRSQDLLV